MPRVEKPRATGGARKGPARTEPDALLAGRYRLVRVIATGGMGVVWEAQDERLRRPVAVKQLRAQDGVTAEEAETAKDRAMREARITARLHHPHAVPVFDVVEHEGQPCIIMQYLPSIQLAAVIAERGPLSPAEVARIGSEVASALAAAHKLKIVHRDVKPGNILLDEDGEAMISDFGISRAVGDATLTRAGLMHGTPAFLAPEVARGGDSTYASDVFSLGSTLYAALEGAPPFGMDRNSIALLHRVARGDVRPPEHAELLAPLLMRMLSTDPDARPTMRSIATQLAALRPLLEPEPTPETAPTKPLPAPAAPAAAAAAAAAAVAAVPAAVAADAATTPPAAVDPEDDLGESTEFYAVEDEVDEDEVDAGEVVEGEPAVVPDTDEATAVEDVAPAAPAAPEAAAADGIEADEDGSDEDVADEDEDESDGLGALAAAFAAGGAAAGVARPGALAPDEPPVDADRPGAAAAPTAVASTAVAPTAVDAVAADRAASGTPTPVATPQRPASDPVVPAKTMPAPVPAAAARTAPPAAVPPARTAPPVGEPPRRGRRIAAIVVGLVVLAILALVIPAIVRGQLERGGDGASGAPSAQSPSTRPSTSQSATPSETPEPTPAETEAAPSPSPSAPAPSATPSAAPPPAPAPISDPPTEGQLADAIAGYYALMPGDTDAAWPRMTADYQENHAGGRDNYEAFWAPVNRVEVSDLRGLPPDGAEATITYYYDDGNVVVEDTIYQLVNEDGILKIAGSDVISSSG